MFGRATITLGIGPHSSICYSAGGQGLQWLFCMMTTECCLVAWLVRAAELLVCLTAFFPGQLG